MPYQINLDDGTFLCTVPDGQTVSTFAGLTLIGKNYAGYGTAFNDNLVHLAENFAGSTPPPNPLTGQIWYDDQANAIKFYNGTAFNSVSVITASATAPPAPSVGDQWYNTTTQQLFIWSGASWVLVGPISTAASGINGIVIGDVIQNGFTYYFVELYADNRLVGIISSDTLVNPGIVGFGNINPGLNFVTSPTSGIVEGGIYNISNLTIGTNNQITAGTNSDGTGYFQINGNIQADNLIYVEGANANISSFNNQGSYITWNVSNGQGETDFINNQGSGTTGGFSWNNSYNANSSVVNVMRLNSSGNLSASGSLSYNVGTANAVTFPSTKGTPGSSILSYGNGSTYWGNVNPSAGGGNGSVQYNSGGSFAGATGVLISGTGGLNLTVTGQLSVTGISTFSSNIYLSNLTTSGAAGQILYVPNGTGGQVTASTVVSINGSGQLVVTNLDVTGPSTLSGQVNTGAGLTVGGALQVTGGSTFNSGVTGTAGAAFSGTVKGGLLATNNYTLPGDAGSVAGGSLLTNANGTTYWDSTSLSSILSGFASSLASNGYQKLPSGMIMQWGVITGPGTAFFPIPFPNQAFGVQACSIYVGGDTRVVQSTALSTTSASFGVSDGASIVIYWYAYGH